MVWVLAVDQWGSQSTYWKERSLKYWVKFILEEYPEARQVVDTESLKVWHQHDHLLILRKVRICSTSTGADSITNES